MANTQGQALCTTCDNTGTRICSGCKSIHYCSIACQKMDWPVHKIICKDYAQFMTTRPEGNHHSAIYFHPDEPKPRFIWLRFEHGYDLPSIEHMTELGLNTEPLKKVPLRSISANPMLDRHIQPHHIFLSVPEAKKLCSCCNSDLKSNDSFIPIDQELADFFRGPVLALGTYCPEDVERDASHLDLGPMDFRHAVDSLRMKYCCCEDDNRSILLGGDIEGVRLNCVADTKFTRRADVETIQEPKSVLLTESDIPTPMADKIGMPLIVRKVQPALLWRNSRGYCRTKNIQAAMLNPPHQSEYTGSLVIVRKDGKPLHPVHVHALFAYTAVKLKDPNLPEGACITAGMLLPDRTTQVSKEDFQDWYATLWQLRPIQHEFIPSPFDIQDDNENEGDDINMKNV